MKKCNNRNGLKPWRAFISVSARITHRPSKIARPKRFPVPPNEQYELPNRQGSLKKSMALLANAISARIDRDRRDVTSCHLSLFERVRPRYSYECLEVPINEIRFPFKSRSWYHHRNPLDRTIRATELIDKLRNIYLFIYICKYSVKFPTIIGARI